MAIWPAYAAAALAGVWFLVHTFVGGRQVGRIRKNARVLDPMPGMCRHLLTVTLFAMAGIFLAATVVPSIALLQAGTLLAAGFAGVGVFATLYSANPSFRPPSVCRSLPSPFSASWR